MASDPIPYREGDSPPSPRHVMAQMVDESGNDLGLFWMNVDEIQARQTLRHEDLGECIGVVRWTWKHLRDFLPYESFEEWERGFLMDANPEREIGLWWATAYAYLQYLHDKPTAESDAVYKTLIQMMMGQQDLAESQAMVGQLDELVRSNPMELNEITPEGDYTGELAHLH